MAGKIKQMIDAFVNQRAQGNSVLEGVVKIKLILMLPLLKSGHKTPKKPPSSTR